MKGNKKEPHDDEALQQINFGDSRTKKQWHKPSLWERVKELLISPEVALILSVLAVLWNLCILFFNHIGEG